ncbi:MAG TPA: hypothetical protein VKE70_03705, partial [Candidatus Solibacter sp.]|nr:hypothetical protein [Candidatus Solibacter sp.]
EWQIGLETTRDAVRLSDQHKLAITSTRFGVSDPMAGPVTVAESGNPVLEIGLSTDTGKIAGKVVGAAKMVVITRPGAMRRSMGPPIMVNSDGSFISGELPPGLYELRALAGGVTKVEVKSGETTNVEIR